MLFGMAAGYLQWSDRLLSSGEIDFLAISILRAHAHTCYHP
jgi:hypothetical protein